MIKSNIIRFTGNLMYVIVIGIVINYGIRCQDYLKNVIVGSQYNPYPNLIFSSFFFIIVGFLIAMPRFLGNVRDQGHWTYDWIRFLSIGLPTFYASVSPLGYFIISDTIWPSMFVHLLFAYNGTLHAITGLVSGYITLTSFEKSGFLPIQHCENKN